MGLTDYSKLLMQISEKTGIPIIINTKNPAQNHIEFSDVSSCVNALETVKSDLPSHLVEALEALRRLDSLLHGGS